MSYEEILNTLLNSDKIAACLYYDEGKHINDVFGIICHASDAAVASGVLAGKFINDRRFGALYSLETMDEDDRCFKAHNNCKRGINWSKFSGAGSYLTIEAFSQLASSRTGRIYGFRPAFPYTLIKGLLFDKQKVARSIGGNIVYEATLPVDELGDIVDSSEQERLSLKFDSGGLGVVDYYPMNSSLIGDYTKDFELIEYPIYKDTNGKKYIRLPKSKYGGNSDFCWYNIVHPKVIYDPKTDFAIYKNVAVGGIRPMDLEEYKKNIGFLEWHVNLR